MGAGGRTGPGPNLILAKAQGKAPGTGSAGSGALGSFSTFGPAAGSFRSSLQAQMASLAGVMESFAAEAASAGKAPEAAESGQDESQANASSRPRALESSLALSLRTAKTQQGVQKATPANSSTVFRAAAAAQRAGITAQGEIAASQAAGLSASAGAAQSAGARTTDHSGRCADAKRAGEETPSAVVSGAALNFQTAAPVPVVTDPVVQVADKGTQLAQTEIFPAVPSASAVDGFGARSVDSGLSGAEPGPGNLVGAQAAHVSQATVTTPLKAGSSQLPIEGSLVADGSQSDGSGAEWAAGSSGAAGATDEIHAQGPEEVQAMGTSPAPHQNRNAQSITDGAAGAGALQMPVAGHAAVSAGSPVPAASAGFEDAALETQGVSSARPATSQGTQRGTRGPGLAGTGEHRTVQVAAQSAGVSMDTAGLMRDPGGARVTGIFTDGTRETSVNAAPRETFAELDAETGPGAPTWTRAGARQAEAGFEDPALGWVGVRAEMSGGGVHASLVPGSNEAAQELGRHMEGLHTYLVEQQTPVESLGLATLNGRGNDAPGGEGSSQQMNQNMQQGAGEGTGRGTDQSSQQHTYDDPQARPGPGGTGIDRSAAAESSVRAAGLERATQIGGVHISVVA